MHKEKISSSCINAFMKSSLSDKFERIITMDNKVCQKTKKDIKIAFLFIQFCLYLILNILFKSISAIEQYTRDKLMDEQQTSNI